MTPLQVTPWTTLQGAWVGRGDANAGDVYDDAPEGDGAEVTPMMTVGNG